MTTSTLPTNYLMPTGREEAWRFTPLTKIKFMLDESFSPSVIDEAKNFSCDGTATLPEGVTFSSNTSLAISDTQDEASLNLRNRVGVISHLSFAEETVLESPFFITRHLQSGDNASRLLISVGKFAKLHLVLSNTGTGNLLEEIEFDIADSAQLTVTQLQEWENGAKHLSHIHAQVGKDATFISQSISVGGEVVRILPTVDFAGPGASAQLDGVYFATSEQHVEYRIHVDHNLPKAKSRVNFKGALAGDSARTVWIGDVYIRANATDTDTYELNRNLLLTDGARADSVPNLEIETGEIVGAGHASTTGRFDDEQLFYLMSRGIPADIARKLVIRGYFTEIISTIGIEEIQERLAARIETELEKVGF
jgi:Fe-S cluster assembly protein SufD